MTLLCDKNRIFFGMECASIGQLGLEAAARLGQQDLSTQRSVFVVDSTREALGCVAFGLYKGLDCGVIERRRLSPEVKGRFSENGVRLVNAQDGTAVNDSVTGAVQPGRVTVLTSGTTGLLKLIPHTAETLNTFDRVQNPPDNSWFLPYQIGSYAWYQMVSLSLFKNGQDLVPGDVHDLVASFEQALRRGQVTAISSTPTFWRLALMSIDEHLLISAPLRSLTLGGEIVDQFILDRLGSLFPQAKIRHIYASSEAGAAIVVSDGKAGFDARLANRSNANISVKIENGRLFIRSAYTNYANLDVDGWVDTGDLVEQRGDRIYFLGRAENTMINVGGQKAFPSDIEAHLMAHPDVLWARVSARKAPLMGALPVAAVVLNSSRATKRDETERMLTAHCQAGLAEYAVPRVWEFHDEIPMRDSLKS